jgi:enoyl-CoA hydratase/carnithine racemase
MALRDAVSDAFHDAADDPEVRVVVLSSSGAVFSAGFDLEEFSTTDHDQLWASSDRFHHVILRHPVPVIAAVQGPAFAGGADLALLADIRLGTPSTVFSHPEATWAPVVYSPLREAIGGARAREMVLTGRTVPAEEALHIGLLTAIVHEDELMRRVYQDAALIARSDRGTLRRMKSKFIERVAIDPKTHTLDL